jgi:hypothetical protein
MAHKIKRYTSDNGTKYELKNHTLRVTGKYGYIVGDDYSNPNDIASYVYDHEEELRILHSEFEEEVKHTLQS